MPRGPLTEEHKAKMAEGRARAQAKKKAEIEAPAQTDMPVEPRPPLEGAPIIEAQNAPDTWGPFLDYQIVTTQHGEYGVPAQEILSFEFRSVFNKASGQFEMAPFPVYEKIQMNDPRNKPSNPEDLKLAAASRKRAITRAEEVLA